ncbi:hypothetical protein DEFR109230_05620 [Deinococcus frigens]
MGVRHNVPMSRGLGKVQRGILGALDAGPLDVWNLARAVGACEASTRRALYGLAKGKRVACLGYSTRGGKRWGLTADVQAARNQWAAVWPVERQQHTARVLEVRYALALRRAVVSAL